MDDYLKTEKLAEIKELTSSYSKKQPYIDNTIERIRLILEDILKLESKPAPRGNKES